MENDIKAIAIHLPQFHPFPENDEWWGKGFTEWTNVVTAKPRFEGHYQPHLPSDLGFYDLRLEEARIAQAELAKQFNIHGFCYYHYWFNGKRLLNRPLDDMIKTQTPDFPFMLCWANENWTRRWDGRDKEVLIKQTYSPSDDLEHIKFLCEHYFNDHRYIKVNNKPFFVIYRPALFPSISETILLWREIAKQYGFDDLYLGYMQSFEFKEDPLKYGFDCAIEFQPDFGALPDRQKGSFFDKLKNKFHVKKSPYYENAIFSYPEYVDKQIHQKKTFKNTYPAITPMWDNTSRRKVNAYIFKDSSPEIYQKWLQYIVDNYKTEDEKGEKFLFINAWNEWAEGNHLEPCEKWGNKYLEATQAVLKTKKS